MHINDIAICQSSFSNPCAPGATFRNAQETARISLRTTNGAGHDLQWLAGIESSWKCKKNGTETCAVTSADSTEPLEPIPKVLELDESFVILAGPPKDWGWRNVGS